MEDYLDEQLEDENNTRIGDRSLGLMSSSLKWSEAFSDNFEETNALVDIAKAWSSLAWPTEWITPPSWCPSLCPRKTYVATRNQVWGPPLRFMEYDLVTSISRFDLIDYGVGSWDQLPNSVWIYSWRAFRSTGLYLFLPLKKPLLILLVISIGLFMHAQPPQWIVSNPSFLFCMLKSISFHVPLLSLSVQKSDMLYNHYF